MLIGLQSFRKLKSRTYVFRWVSRKLTYPFLCITAADERLQEIEAQIETSVVGPSEGTCQVDKAGSLPDRSGTTRYQIEIPHVGFA